MHVFNSSKHRATINNVINLMRFIKEKPKTITILKERIGKYHKTIVTHTAVIFSATDVVFITDGNTSVEII